MPPRLSHKKSRKGCLRCKARKVKCDELRPICNACQRHKLICEWPDLVHSSMSMPTPIDHPSSSITRPSGPITPYDAEGVKAFEPEERRVLELHLLHYYLTIDATNLPLWKDPPYLRAVWTIDAINHALRHSFLLYAIYAIAALHAAVVGTDNSRSQPQAWFRWQDKQPSNPARTGARSLTPEDYANAHRFYLNLATRSLCEELPYLDSANADAVVLASILLSIVAQNLILQSEQPYEPPTQWISLSNSINSVIQAAQPCLSDAPIIEIIMNMDPIMKDRNAVFNPSNLTPFLPILDFQPASGENLLPTDRDTYTQALSYAGGVYQLIHQNPSPQPFQIKRRINSFPPMIPSRFSTLLAQRQPRALLVIAHLMSMAKIVEEHWWVPREAEKHVYGVQSILPQEWQWAMKWPLDTLAEMTALKKALTERVSDSSIAIKS